MTGVMAVDLGLGRMVGFKNNIVNTKSDIEGVTETPHLFRVDLKKTTGPIFINYSHRFLGQNTVNGFFL